MDQLPLEALRFEWLRVRGRHSTPYPSLTDSFSHRYAVDSLLLLLQSIIASSAALELNAAYSRALTIAVYVGMLTGAIFWGLSADIIGRKIAFNVSLFICSVAVIVAGAAPSWTSLAFFIAMTGFGGGGNLILDTTVFLEYLPSNKQWVLSLLIVLTLYCYLLTKVPSLACCLVGTGSSDRWIHRLGVYVYVDCHSCQS